jgi:hypothetical protein
MTMKSLLAMALSTLFVVALTPYAQAQDYRWSRRLKCDRYYGFCNWVWYRYRVHHKPISVFRYRDNYRYHDERRGLCQDREIQVVSTEHTNEDNARESARKLWMAFAGWRDGERFMDLDQAADVRWSCGPSSAMGTITGRISQAAEQMVGKGGQNVRCELRARPCEAPLEPDRDRRR